MVGRKDGKQEEESLVEKNREQKWQIEGNGKTGDVFFPLPFISPQCHPDYISATC